MVELENAGSRFQENVQPSGRFVPVQPSTGKPLLVVRKLPALLLMVSVVLVSSLFLFMTSTLAGMKYALVNQKGLSLYQDIFPGQSVTGLERFACQGQRGAINTSGVIIPSGLCSIFPQREPFHLIQIRTSEDQIKEATFFSQGLQPEVLFTYWGEPDMISRGTSKLSYHLEWYKPDYEVSAIVNESSRTVRLITLRSKG